MHSFLGHCKLERKVVLKGDRIVELVQSVIPLMASFIGLACVQVLCCLWVALYRSQRVPPLESVVSLVMAMTALRMAAERTEGSVWYASALMVAAVFGACAAVDWAGMVLTTTPRRGAS